jgi:ribose 1,5-bisphosphate isomerase
MAQKPEDVAKRIKSLQIQGARNIAKAAIESIIFQVTKSKAKTRQELYSELLEAADSLAAARPTEPMLRNAVSDAISFTFMQIRTHPENDVWELKSAILSEAKSYLPRMEAGHSRICDYGSRLIQDGALVVTHCHSSTVTGILRRAHEYGTKFSVVCFETRPRFQGRLTAAELCAAGIDTTLAVDGAMAQFLRKADLCMVGADAITSMGDLINKVGTSSLAKIARVENVSFYSAAELYKYDPLTLFGNREKIEERDTAEVWDKPPKGLKIRNPAFDATAARYINGYVTEMGVIPPQSLWSIALSKMGGKVE